MAGLVTAGYLFGQTPEAAPPTNPPASENVPASEQNAGIEKDQPAENAHLAEAGQFKLTWDWSQVLLLGLGLLALAVAIERSYVLHKNKGNNAELVRILAEKLATNPTKVDDLAEEIATKEFGLEGRVAAVTLRGWTGGDEAMEEYAQSAIIAEKRTLDRRLVILSTLGNNTPFIGLLGTVLGIMRAFRDLATMGDAGPAVVMKGISEALIATAFGLGVAIPCVIAFNLLGKTVKDRISFAEEIVSLIRAMRISTLAESGTNGRGNLHKLEAQTR